MSQHLKLLAVCDTPTCETGFGRVARNLLLRWHKCNGGPFDDVEIWGINYRGERHRYPFWIYQAGGGEWATPQNMQGIPHLLGRKVIGGTNELPYTHLWILQDSFMLSRHQFPTAIKETCASHKVRSAYYMPVDAALERPWLDIVNCMDATVLYTEFGKREILKALPATYNPAMLRVIPHGCDTRIYRPLENRDGIRAEMFKPSPNQPPFLEPGDFLMINVNSNQRRKDVGRSLRILKRLIELRRDDPKLPPFKLLMHMPRVSADDVDLSLAGAQLGLRERIDWFCSEIFFTTGGFALAAEDVVARLYNAADLNLSTSLGEGWGFNLTEALGCGCPLAAPRHTSCIEIMEKLAGFNIQTPMLPLDVGENEALNAWDNTRFRAAVKVEAAAEMIAGFARTYKPDAPRHGYTEEAKAWLDWDRIAKEWWPVFQV